MLFSMFMEQTDVHVLTESEGTRFCRSKWLRSDLQRVHGLLPAIYVGIEEAELIQSVSAA
jgi:hypothetical protein